MANQFVNLPCPASNTSGAAVDVSSFGALKTFVVAGAWTLPDRPPTVTIEMNNSAGPTGTWAPVCTFQGAGAPITVACAARWMRATVSNYRGGAAADVNLGGTDDGATFAALPVTAGNGTGAPVDISALPLFKTVQIGDAFSGPVIIEISEDAGGVDWAEAFCLWAPGQYSQSIAGYWARVKRSGVNPLAPGLPIVTMGATDPSTGGGGSVVFTTVQVQELRFAPAITPAALAAGVTNDYGPVGFASTTRVRQATDAANSTLNGLVAQNDGDLRIIENLGPGTLTIANEAGASAAANRFTCPGATDLTVNAGGAVQVIYDGTLARWLLIAAVGIPASAVTSFAEISLTPAISPAALAAGVTNDYGPAGLATNSVIRQATDAGGSTLNGLVAQGDGDIRILENLGPGTLTLANEAGASAAANRFTLPGATSAIVPTGGTFVVVYDLTTARWRMVAMGSGGALITNMLLVNTTLTSDGVLLAYQSRFSGYIVRSSATSPAALAVGTTNDYDISAAMLGANRIRQATDAANSALSGMVPIGLSGAEWILANLGPGTLTLLNEDGGSAAANRFALESAAPRVIGVSGAVIITYDGTLARWLVIG